MEDYLNLAMRENLINLCNQKIKAGDQLEVLSQKLISLKAEWRYIQNTVARYEFQQENILKEQKVLNELKSKGETIDIRKGKQLIDEFERIGSLILNLLGPRDELFEKIETLKKEEKKLEDTLLGVVVDGRNRNRNSNRMPGGSIAKDETSDLNADLEAAVEAIYSIKGSFYGT